MSDKTPKTAEDFARRMESLVEGPGSNYSLKVAIEAVKLEQAERHHADLMAVLTAICAAMGVIARGVPTPDTKQIEADMQKAADDLGMGDKQVDHLKTEEGNFKKCGSPICWCQDK